MSLQTEVYKIAVVTDKDLPTDHSFLQGVFENVLPRHSHKITFIGFGETNIKRSHVVSYKLVSPWGRNFAVRKFQKLWVFTKLINECKPEVLFTRNDPVYLIVAWMLKWRYPQLIHVHQISHLHAYSTGLRKQLVFRIKATGDLMLRKFFLRKADLILLISEEMRNFLQKRWSKHSDKFRIYPLGVLTSEFQSNTPMDTRSYDIAYIGTLSKSRELKTIIDGLQIYNKTNRHATLHIWGQSHNKADDEVLRKYVMDTGLTEHVRFYGRVSRAEVLGALQQVKIGLSVIPPKGLLKQISPTKLMEYMASGCFVIASRGITDQEKIITESQTGILIDFESQQLAGALQKAFGSAEWIEQSGTRGREYILKHRSYEEMGKQLMQDIDQIRR